MGRLLLRNACPEVGREDENTEKATYENKGKHFFYDLNLRELQKGMDIIFSRTLEAIPR